MDDAARTLLDACPEDEVTVIGRLTDADLVALLGTDADALAPLPTLRSVDPAGRELAGRTAAASIAVHGLSVDAAGELSVEQTLAGLVVLRRHPQALLHAEQQTADAGSVLVGYVHEGGRCLLEEVSPDGVHRFVVAATTRVVDDVVAWSLPDLGEGSDGEPVDLADEEFTQRSESLVGGSQRVTVVVGTRARPEGEAQRRVTIYERADECVLVMRIDPGHVRVVGASRTRTTGVVASLLTA